MDSPPLASTALRTGLVLPRKVGPVETDTSEATEEIESARSEIRDAVDDPHVNPEEANRIANAVGAVANVIDPENREAPELRRLFQDVDRFVHALPVFQDSFSPLARHVQREPISANPDAQKVLKTALCGLSRAYGNALPALVHSWRLQSCTDVHSLPS